MTDSSRAWCAALLCSLGLLPALALGDVNVSGSAYVDYLGTRSPSARASSLSGITPELALKVEVDATEHLSFSAKACLGCHGVSPERFHAEWTPKPWINAQAGRIVVPFGDFSMRYDPSGHATASKPLIYEMGRMLYFRSDQFNLGVVPTPYVDNGVLLYGQAWLKDSVQVWYGGYAVGGFKGENDLDWSSLYQAYFNDNNAEPSGGARVVATYSASSDSALLKDLSLGASFMYGHYNRAANRSYLAAGLDLSSRVGPLTLRAEGALRRTDIDASLPGYRYEIVDPWIETAGFYGEIQHPVTEWLVVSYRFDGLRRQGVPLPGSDARLSAVSTILRYTQGVQVNIASGLFAKLGYEYWLLSDFPTAHVFHLGAGGAF